MNSSGLLRGAYLINSVCVFVVYYLLFYQIHLKRWIQNNKSKLATRIYFLIFTLCLIYQVRNYTKWIQIFGYQKRAIQSVSVLLNGNTKELYKDDGNIYNIPLNMRSGLGTLIKKGVFDPKSSLENLLTIPINEVSLSGNFDNKIEIRSIDGIEIVENPYITISAKITGFLKNPSNDLGIELYQNGTKLFYKIPLKNDKLFFIKSIKGRDFYFEFIIPKKQLTSSDVEIRFLKFQNGKILQHTQITKFSWHRNKPLFNDLAEPIGLIKKDWFIEKTSKSEFYEAFYDGNNHTIIIKTNSFEKNTEYYLQFTDIESSNDFQLPLKYYPEKRLLKVSFKQTSIRNFLKSQNTLFKLSLFIQNKTTKIEMQELKSLYYFNF